MGETLTNNKRIAKNTMMLYIRMFLIMIMSLFTSRIILRTLGEEDFGIFNVVGGIIIMFSFLNTAMTASTQRFLTFELGKGDKEQLKRVFISSRIIHYLIALVVLILGETLGLWFFANKMNIPIERQPAAMWVYQCSIIVSLLNIINVPYRATIIAHERMSAFAVISIIDAIIKLLIALALLVIDYDRLICLAVLTVFEHFSIVLAYKIYGLRYFIETKSKWLWNKGLLHEMLSFASWSLFGNFAVVLYTQGLNILLNIFFGPSLNAARGVAVQADSAITQFANNFQTALNPQITKTYAMEAKSQMFSLIYRSCRFSFILLFIVALPIFIEAPLVLQLWLGAGHVPEYAAGFLRIILGTGLLISISNPFTQAASATGKIRRYQIVVGGILIAIVPLSYLVLSLGGNPYSVFYVYLAVSLIAFIARLKMLKGLIGMNVKDFISNVLYKVFPVVIFSPIIPCVMHYLLIDNYINMFIIIIMTVVFVAFFSAIFTLTPNEKQFIYDKLKNGLKARVINHA